MEMGGWEDLDRWKWVVIDVGVILDTSASHSENCFSTCFGAGWGTTRPYLRVPSEFSLKTLIIDKPWQGLLIIMT